MSDFDKELREALYQAWRDGRDGLDRYESVDTLEKIIKQAVEKHVLPPTKSTIEELDEANKNLDSRLFQHYHSFNEGYLKAVKDILTKIRGKSNV